MIYVCVIVNINQGSSTSGALDYVRGPGRDDDGRLREPNDRAKLLGGQGVGYPIDSDRAAEVQGWEMEYNSSSEMQSNKTFPCEKDCTHFSMSWAKDQTPSDE